MNNDHLNQLNLTMLQAARANAGDPVLYNALDLVIAHRINGTGEMILQSEAGLLKKIKAKHEKLPSVKIVFGDQAVAAHKNGTSDEHVTNLGAIQNYTFQTVAEKDAFLRGIEETRGYIDACIYEVKDG